MTSTIAAHGERLAPLRNTWTYSNGDVAATGSLPRIASKATGTSPNPACMRRICKHTNEYAVICTRAFRM
jgi:hypothetical protein